VFGAEILLVPGSRYARRYAVVIRADIVLWCSVLGEVIHRPPADGNPAELYWGVAQGRRVKPSKSSLVLNVLGRLEELI
jgi:hypothetical protein